MDGMQASLSVQIAAGPDSDQEELDRLSLDLRHELLELDVDSVVRAPNGPAPSNAMAVGTSLSDVLIVSLSNSTVLVSVIHALGWWIKRGTGRRARVKIGGNIIEIDSASTEDKARLIELWLDWHEKH
jgi:membrane-associated two-gene conflict system component 1 (EACC1)